MTREPITQIEIIMGVRNISGFSDFDAAAPTSNANITKNNGLATRSRT